MRARVIHGFSRSHTLSKKTQADEASVITDRIVGFLHRTCIRNGVTLYTLYEDQRRPDHLICRCEMKSISRLSGTYPMVSPMPQQITVSSRYHFRV